jgi:hypothetical protein
MRAPVRVVERVEYSSYDQGMPYLSRPDGEPSDIAPPAYTGDPSPPITIWVSLNRPEGGGVHIRVTDADDHWVITDVYVHGAQLSASDLQGAPITHLDLMMNLVEDFDPFTIAEAFQKMGQKVLADPDPEPSLAALRERAADAPAELPAMRPQERPKLTRPDGTDPDGFSARVAAAYREYVMQTRSPALKIAEEAKVPVGTARGWIREARRRGKLPQGRKGRVG